MNRGDEGFVGIFQWVVVFVMDLDDITQPEKGGREEASDIEIYTQEKRRLLCIATGVFRRFV